MGVNELQPQLLEYNRKRRNDLRKFKQQPLEPKPSSNPQLRELQNCLREVGRRMNKGTFLYYISKLAYEDTKVALKVFDKLIADQSLPKDKDESTGIRQLIIIRPDQREEAQEVSRPIHIQSESVSRDVEQLGHRKDDVINISGNAIQRAST